MQSRYLFRMTPPRIVAICMALCFHSFTPSLPAAQPKVILAAEGFALLPRSLSSMSYPYSRVPRVVMSGYSGKIMVACDSFPLPTGVSSGEYSLLDFLRRQVVLAHPEVTWGWGGAYSLAGREWAAWDFVHPSMTGSVSTIVAATKVGSSILAISVSSPTAKYGELLPSLGQVLSSVKVIVEE